MLTKEEFTRKALEVLAEDSAYSFDLAIVIWWQDRRDEGGMRLTETGHHYFKQVFEHWKFDIDSNTPTKAIQLLMLNQHITWPYYLKTGSKPNITFYNSREATMYSLYGNIDKFTVALKNSR
jgi:hypothetical protein